MVHFVRAYHTAASICLAVKVDSQSMLNSEGTLTAKGNINISSKYSAPTYKVNTEISVIKPVSGMEQTQEEAEKTQKAGAAIGTGMGITMVLFIWAIGDIITGLLALMTRPKA